MSTLRPSLSARALALQGHAPARRHLREHCGGRARGGPKTSPTRRGQPRHHRVAAHERGQRIRAVHRGRPFGGLHLRGQAGHLCLPGIPRQRIADARRPGDPRLPQAARRARAEDRPRGADRHPGLWRRAGRACDHAVSRGRLVGPLGRDRAGAADHPARSQAASRRRQPHAEGRPARPGRYLRCPS